MGIISNLSVKRLFRAKSHAIDKPTQPGLPSRFRNWPLGRKMVAVYGLAFAVTLTGIVTGFGISLQIKREAFAIQAEAIEDVEFVSFLKESLFKLLLYKQITINIPEAHTKIMVEKSQGKIASLLEAHENFKRDWENFRASDELNELEETDGVTETEAKLAVIILKDHEAAINEYIEEMDELFLQVSPSAIKAEQIPFIQENLRQLDQSTFITDLESFIEKITALADATEEEKQAATELLQQASVNQVSIMLVSTLLSGLSGLGLVVALSHQVLLPLRTITKTTQQSVKNACYNLQIPVTSQDEVGTLAETFNDYAQFVRRILTQQKDTNQQLQKMLKDLCCAQAQMIQTEKMSSLGQLIAGIAHEINNPVTFIYSNLTYVRKYTQNLLGLIHLYQRHYPHPVPEIQNRVEDIDLEFIQEDLPKTLTSMKVGSDRIGGIVRSLRNFSHKNDAELKPTDIHQGLDDTLVILQHRLKALSNHPKIHVIRDYAMLPMVECYGGLLNQVFMNVISNAIDALEEDMAKHPYEENLENPSTITLRTSLVDTPSIEKEWVQIEISDNGPGVPKDIQKSIFDPFFTTKPIGKGSGIGLSISYQIITERHGGKLECLSMPGRGTRFAIQIPLKQ